MSNVERNIFRFVYVSMYLPSVKYHCVYTLIYVYKLFCANNVDCVKQKQSAACIISMFLFKIKNLAIVSGSASRIG